MAEPAGTVTCDLEGRILTFDPQAERLFGYPTEEVVGKKRIQALTTGLVAVGQLPGWLAAARRDGRFQTVTALRGRDGRPFSAQLTVTPLEGGFCTTALACPEVPVATAAPVSPGARVQAWLGIARAPFLTATVAPVVFAGAWAWGRGLASPFPWGLFALTVVAAALLHTSANLLNDYFDWKSGADGANNDHFAPFSGGSRSIELGLLSPGGVLAAGLTALALATALGGVLAWWRGWGLMAFGAAGAFAALFYTAPPLRLVARRGLGELTVALCFGPLMVAGAVYALTGTADLAAYVAGLPLGLLTLAILWINEIPDLPADQATGKINLVVVLGARRASRGYLVVVALAFASVLGGVAAGMLSVWALAALLALPLAVRAGRIALAHYGDRSLVRANAGTIQLQLAVGVLLTVGSVVGALLTRP